MHKINIECFDTIDSTNDQAIFQIKNNILKNDKIIISRHQTNGHGANGHTFISDSGVGIYFSFVHFYTNVKELSYITQKACVAVYKTFKDIFNIDLCIKWVNDLLYNNKKVAGILCRNLINYKALIIGIGIDLFYNQSLDISISHIAGSIFKDIDELILTLNNNNFLSKESYLYKSIYNDFYNKKIFSSNKELLYIPNNLVSNIVENILYYISKDGLPKIYIEKNICKGDKIYEDCVLEC